jgi:uncharacterized membrane protein HdeD (DUF308 family)
MLDLRIPSGWFFAIVGVILLVFGLFEPDARSTLTDANVDLYCGVAMLVFGGFLLALAFRASRHSS